MAGIHLMHSGGDDGPAIEACHVLFHLVRLPGWLRQSNVKESFLGNFLKWPGSVHRCERECARKWRRLLNNRQHFRGSLTMLVLGQKILQSAQSIAKRLQQLVRSGMVFFQFFQDLLRRLVGVEFCRRIFECLLVQPQVGHTDLKQAIQRDINVLVIEKLFAEIVGADTEVAVCLRLQVFLYPLPVAFQFVHYFLVRGTEISQQRLVFYIFKGGRYIILEEADQAGNLLQRNVDVDGRRVLQVLPCCLKNRRHLLFARDNGFEPLVSRRERTRHDKKNRVGNAGRIYVWVLLPRADLFQSQQVAR